MTRRTWTSVVAAGTFVVLVALSCLLPVPFVAWGPGRTVDLLGQGTDDRPAVEVTGVKTYPATGQLRMTTVSVTRVDSSLTLPQALWAWVRPNRDVLPREVVYPRDKSADQVHGEEVAQMDTSRSDAVVAALQAARLPVTRVPMVKTVSTTGPAFGKLQPGDLVERIDQTAVTAPDQVTTLVRKHAVGDQVVFTVRRDGKHSDVTVTTVASNQNKAIPVVGVTLDTGYQYAPRVTWHVDPEVVGPSAGLVFGLAVYDLVTPGDLLGGRSVAGTGEIAPGGAVGPIGGIQEKIAGAEQQGAKVFLVPAGNCRDLQGVQTTMDLVKVTSLGDAITSLTQLKANPSATVPHC